jgi:predicted GIY-YIG superfamily endonuclease
VQAANNPESRPLTAFGYRTGSTQTIGWGKVGNLGADGGGSLSSGAIYFGTTVNTFQVWAFRRCVFNASDPSVCDLYMLIGHPRWNSVYGGVTFDFSPSTDNHASHAKMDGTTNVIAVTMLLSKPGGAEVTAAECQTVVDNMTARMKLFFYF